MKLYLKHKSNLRFFQCEYLLLVFILCCYINKGVVSQSFNTTTASVAIQTSTVSNNHSVPPLSCQYAPGLVPGDRLRIEECCNETVKKFETYWSKGKMYLTTYLQTLKNWECPQYHKVCQEKRFAFNQFTQLVYNYFCDYETFVSECIELVNDTFISSIGGNNVHANSVMPKSAFDVAITSRNSTQGVTSVISNADSSWLSLVKKLSSQQLTLEQVMIPCVQIALYQAEEASTREYHEVIDVYLPSCEVTWCGYNGDTLSDRVISIWTCMSTSCRAKMISIIVICGILGILISIANVTVILVLYKNPVLRHSQGIYKLSLAVADIIIGIVVFPTFITSLISTSTASHLIGDFVNVTGYVNNNSALNEETFQVREPGKLTKFIFTNSYLNAVGFFTVTSFLVSIYTLTLAGFDRLQVVYRPLRYSKDAAKNRAKKYCAAIWLIASLLAFLPMFVPTLSYGLVASVLVSSGGQSALILYAVGFIIPLIIMWTVSCLTYHLTKKHTVVQNKVPINLKNKSYSVELQLAKTLSIMVGAFSLSIIPAAVVILASLFATTIYLSSPQTFIMNDALIYNAFEFASIIILACNSLWNFFIYSARSYEFRKTLKLAYRNWQRRSKLRKCCGDVDKYIRRVSHSGTLRVSSNSVSSKASSTRKTTNSMLGTKSTNISTKKDSNKPKHEGASTAETKSSPNSHLSTNNCNGIAETSLTTSKQSIEYAYSRKPFANEINKDGDGSEVMLDNHVHATDSNDDKLYVSVIEKIDEKIIEEKYEI